MNGLIRKILTIINRYTPNIRVSRYMEQTLTGPMGEVESSTKIKGDFSAALSLRVRKTR